MKPKFLHIALRSVVSSLMVLTIIIVSQNSVAQDVTDPVVDDPWCYLPSEPNFEQPIKTALSGEGVTLSLVASSTDLTRRQMARLKMIAKSFNRIALRVIKARSYVMMDYEPAPDPDPPNYLRMARNAQRVALSLVRLLEMQIDRVYDQGLIGEEDYDELTGLHTTLQDMVSAIPITVP